MKASNIFIVVIIFILIGCDNKKYESNLDIKISNKKAYAGGWPFNETKDLILDPGFGDCPKANGCECDSDSSCPENSVCAQLYRGKYCVPKEGSIVPRFKGIDQFGEEFDLYDLANQGKPILIEIGSTTAQACQDFSACRSHQSDDVVERKWWKSKFSRLRDLIDNKEILWVNIIHLDENKNPANPETVSLWNQKYPHDNIIIMADPNSKMKKWIRPTGLPCMIVVDEDMILRKHAFRGIEDAIDAVYDILD